MGVEDLTEYIPFLTVLSLYGVFGTIGNVLILIVYWKERVKLSHTLFIKTLSIVDLTVCGCIVPYTVTFELHLIKHDFICRLAELIRHVLVLYSNFILIAIAIERYFAVCKPMKKLKYEHLRVILVAFMIVSVAISLPALTIFTVCKESECLGRPVTGYGNSSTGSNDTTYIYNNIKAPEEEFCQFTTTILGPVGTYVYQGAHLFLFFIGFLVFVIVYPMVCRVVLKRSYWRRNRVGVVRMNDLQLDTSNSGKIIVQPQGTLHTQTTRATSKSGSTQEGTSTAHALATVSTTNHLQVTPNYTSSASKGLQERRKMKNSKTETMLFVCTFIFVLVWIPFFIDVFTAVENLTFRYLFLLGHVTNPIVYGIINKDVRAEIWRLFSRLR